MGNISKEEFQERLSNLRREGGLSDTDIKDLHEIASGHFDRNVGLGGSRSISRDEAREMIKTLRAHPSWHHLSKDQIQEVEKGFEKDLTD